MKKKILGIIASPRRLGNCEIFIKEISRNFEFEHDLNLIRLSDFDIKPCKGCYGCLFGPKTCHLKDDLNVIIEAMKDADALIVAVPTYFLGPNGMLKTLLDRGLSFYAHADKLWHKPAIGVRIAGLQGKEGYTLLGVESFLKSVLADIKHRLMVYGALPGEVFLNPENRRTAQRLAEKLFEPTALPEGPRCPLCYGDSFRFLGNNQVQCLLCSHHGTISFQNHQIDFDIVPVHHGIILTAEQAVLHRKWLESMRDRFIEAKPKLKKIILDYRKVGGWITPEKKS